MFARIGLRSSSCTPRSCPPVSKQHTYHCIRSIHTHLRYPHPPRPVTNRFVIRSSSGFAIALIALSAALLTSLTFVHQKGEKGNNAGNTSNLSQDEEACAIMAGAPLPGRPGNLTPEQQEKLKEFWAAVLQVFGVEDLNSGERSSDHSTAAQNASTKAAASEKKSKNSRGGLFGKKKDDQAASGPGGASSADGEDKYGHVRDYQKVLDNNSPEDLRRAFWSMVKHDNPDGLLLRFLRARKWNVQNALVMMIATMHWRMQEQKVDEDIVKRGEAGAAEDSDSSNASVKKDGEDFLAQLRMGKSFLRGTDKEGRPMCFCRVRLHKQGEQTESSLERYTVFTIETARLLLSGNVDTAAIVFDMTDFSLANMDYAPVKFMIKCFEANYPESLGVVLVHKSPWIFHSIWKIIRGWLDPVVAAKVHFTKNTDDLAEFVPIDHIPHELGGKDPWTYKYLEPVAGENHLMEDHATRDRLVEQRAMLVNDFEKVTQQWLHSQSTDFDSGRQTLADRLRTGYWELDPYLRAKTYCDRAGMIGPGGKIQFYPTQDATKPTANGGPARPGHGDDGLD